MYSLNIMTQQKNCLPNLLFWLLFIYMMHVKIRKFFSWSCVSLKTLKLYRHFSFEKKLLWQILSLLIFFSFCFRITLILFWFLNYRLLLGNKSLIFFFSEMNYMTRISNKYCFSITHMWLLSQLSISRL